MTFKQDISLPAGCYQLTALGRSSQDVTLTLFAGDETAEMAHINATGGLFNNGWEQTSVEFELTKPATVSIGVRGVTSVIHNWMSFSDFRLVQFPLLITGIEEMKNEELIMNNEIGEVYDLSGRRLSNGKGKMKKEELPKGVYIIRGRKVVVK